MCNIIPNTKNSGSTQKKRGFAPFVITILLLIAFCKTALVVWALSRGIELGDEGFYLMAYKYWYKYRFVDFFVVFAKWVNPTTWTVVQLRFLKIVIEVTGTSVLCFSFYRYAVYKQYIKPSIGTVLFFVGFVFQGLYISFEARTASYNDFCVVLNYISFSCLLLIFSEVKLRDQSGGYFLSGLAGICGGLLLAPKFPSAFVHPFAIGGLLFFNPECIRNKAKLFAVYAICFAIAFAGVVKTLGGLYYWYSELSAMFEASKFLGYGFWGLLKNHLISILLVLLAVTVSIFPFVFYKLKNKGLPQSPRILYLTILLPVFIVVFLTFLDKEKMWARETVFTINTWLVLSYFFLSIANLTLNGVKVPLFLLFISILLPFVIIVGTNTPLLESLYGCNAPFLCVVFIFLYKSMMEVSGSPGGVMGGGIVVSLTGYFFIVYLMFPYGLDSNLFKQNMSYNFRDEKILVSKEVKIFFETTLTSLHQKGFKEGDPIIALDLYPGLVYVLEGYSPTMPWYAIQNGKSYEFNCHFFRSYNRQAEQGKLPWIMFFQPPETEQAACLKNSPINFPAGYVFVDSIYCPYSQNPDFMFGGQVPPYIKMYAPL